MKDYLKAMNAVREKSDREKVRTASGAAFWHGLRDGLGSVVFTVGASNATFQLGSPSLDRRRMVALKAMLRAQTRQAQARDLRNLVSAIRVEAKQNQRD